MINGRLGENKDVFYLMSLRQKNSFQSAEVRNSLHMTEWLVSSFPPEMNFPWIAWWMEHEMNLRTIDSSSAGEEVLKLDASDIIILFESIFTAIWNDAESVTKNLRCRKVSGNIPSWTRLNRYIFFRKAVLLSLLLVKSNIFKWKWTINLILCSK